MKCKENPIGSTDTMQTNTTTRLSLEGFNASKDLVLHGIDLVSSEDDDLVASLRYQW
jgi:hypothetical protein